MALDLERYLSGDPPLLRRIGLVGRARRKAQAHPSWAACFLRAASLAVLSLGWGVWSRLQSRSQVAHAQRFALQAREIEYRLALERMLPIHDMRPALQKVEEQIHALERELPGLGEAARGPGLEAIGRGRLALGEAVDGLRALEQAWESGYHSPELALALVRAHVGAFEEEHPGWAQPGTREAMEARRRFHAERAQACAPPAEGLAAHPYEASLVAFLRGDAARAVDLARAAVSQDPLALEPRVHLVRVLTTKAHLSLSEGQRETALKVFQEVAVAAREAQEVGRSLDAAYAKDLAWRLTLLAFDLDPRPAWVGDDAALEALCEVRLRLDSRNASALSDKLTLQYRRAERELNAGLDPRERLLRALAQQTEAESWAPNSSNIRADGLMIHLLLAQRALLFGGPAEPHLRLALERAAAPDTRPRDAQPKLRLIQARLLSREGLDPSAALQAGLARAEERFKTTGDPAFLYEIGRLGLQSHRVLARVSAGSGSHLEHAEQAASDLCRRDPGDSWNWELAGWVHLERARQERTAGHDSRRPLETAWHSGRRALGLAPWKVSHTLLLTEIALQSLEWAGPRQAPQGAELDRAREWVRRAHLKAPGWERSRQLAKRLRELSLSAPPSR